MIKLPDNLLPRRADINSYPRIFSLVSIPLRLTSNGFNDNKTRYTITSGGIDLELLSASSKVQLPTGHLGRVALAYISSKIIRQQLGVIKSLRSLGWQNRSDEWKREHIDEIQFRLPSLSMITKEMLGIKRKPSTKEKELCHKQLIAVLRMGITLTTNEEFHSYYEFPNYQFFLTKEVFISKRETNKNYVVFTKEGYMMFLSYVVPIIYDDFIKLTAIEQDLLVYLIRKTQNPKLQTNEFKNETKLNCVIKVENIVKQIFNVDKGYKNYARCKNKIYEAYKNLINLYYPQTLAYCLFWNKDDETLTIGYCKDPVNTEEQKKKLVENRLKYSLIKTIENYKKQAPYKKAYYERKALEVNTNER